MNTFPVSEIFGPTIQGEGPAAGRSSSFLRLGGCNLSCSWCDSAYTWNGEQYDLRAEFTDMTWQQIVDELPAAPITVLTGGEPLLHQKNGQWPSLVNTLWARAELHVETNGTIQPTAATVSAVSLFVVSPKMSHAGTHRGKQDPTMWPGWVDVNTSVLKVVVKTAADVDATVSWATRDGWTEQRIWVMPEGTDSLVLADRWPDVAQRAADLGINASHRLHVLAWHDRRGH